MKGQSIAYNMPSIFVTSPKYSKKRPTIQNKPLFYDPKSRSGNIWKEVLDRKVREANISLSFSDSDDSDSDFSMDYSLSSESDFDFSPKRNLKNPNPPFSSLFYAPGSDSSTFSTEMSDDTYDEVSDDSDSFSEPPKPKFNTTPTTLFFFNQPDFTTDSFSGESNFSMSTSITTETETSEQHATDDDKSGSDPQVTEIIVPSSIKTRSVRFTKKEENDDSELIQIPNIEDDSHFETPKEIEIPKTQSTINMSSETESDDSMIEKICSRIKSPEWSAKLEKAIRKK
ncbi:fibrinogen-binding protein, putative [Trichomonas vaginalis G3]|uniref:Fibrinogen-binding protein, putative n=1 Tax=Trichomonas vaginalis (strain ATCC PRA-98 / G3) TaxID=412133 RepID=A2EI93_TRIV3|nr:hypothetical protein TVAGG3_0858550 [Trichomonas vaginalis G3]EAY07653.1 fibrinogen-binding protein, putative [Trichomonas vaginalis G3]KAI5500504.1 hypothetical protein TVAGG3_0858550 [Trichomonas vaginalis G3]|eukprot:XP_001319876.1 fibrinogen-binding protein [Trichomonas vaginalis G3]